MRASRLWEVAQGYSTSTLTAGNLWACCIDVSAINAAALQRCEPLVSAVPQRSALKLSACDWMPCRLQSRLEDMKIGYRLPENNYSQQAIDFMDKVLDISGLGDATFLSDGGCLLPHT